LSAFLTADQTTPIRTPTGFVPALSACGGFRPRVTTAPFAQSPAEDGSTMRNFVAPLGFTLLSAWVVVLFVLAHNTP
jgi:hypothetical protein